MFSPGRGGGFGKHSDRPGAWAAPRSAGVQYFRAADGHGAVP